MPGSCGGHTHVNARELWGAYTCKCQGAVGGIHRGLDGCEGCVSGWMDVNTPQGCVRGWMDVNTPQGCTCVRGWMDVNTPQGCTCVRGWM